MISMERIDVDVLVDIGYQYRHEVCGDILI